MLSSIKQTNEHVYNNKIKNITTQSNIAVTIDTYKSKRQQNQTHCVSIITSNDLSTKSSILYSYVSTSKLKIDPNKKYKITQ